MNLKTSNVSNKTSRGVHTTRHVELLNLYDGLIADTPGFSSLEFTDMKNEDIRDNFVEFNIYRHDCEYKDCMHTSETKCKIKEELKKGNILPTRYENYLKFLKR
mgnify:CR=1 FL=1